MIINKDRNVGDIYTSSQRFSDISENKVYSLGKIKEIFVDANSGDYSIKDIEKLRESIHDFQDIPINEIGRRN